MDRNLLELLRLEDFPLVQPLLRKRRIPCFNDWGRNEAQEGTQG